VINSAVLMAENLALLLVVTSVIAMAEKKE
jgi:hypothetical protein